MNPRLLRLELRRSLAVWLVLPLVAIGYGLVPAGNLPATAMSWANMSGSVPYALIVAGPLLAGLAAWAAGRERRRGLDDLLASTPRPAWSRQLPLWAAVTLWTMLAYLLFAIAVVVITLHDAVWGSPFLSPMIVGLLALPAEGAVGFALGRHIPSRFAAPLVAIAVFLLQIVVGWAPGAGAGSFGWVSFLSPLAFEDKSVWYGISPDVGLPQALFLLGVTGGALGTLAPPERSRGVSWVPLLGAGAVTLAGVALLIHDTPLGGAAALQNYRVYGRHPVSIPASYYQTFEHLIPYRPVCADMPIPVCIHPAYRPWLSDNASVLNRLMAPLLGISGAPTRAEQRPLDGPVIVGSTLVFPPVSDPFHTAYVVNAIALALVRNSPPHDALPQACLAETTMQSCIATLWAAVQDCQDAQNALA
ncbi:MAG TPA: hypothetical protein VGP33_07745, partial [Chloroflexota bacterium]|nr:hypothetical protein [Chloroflexota bacterium]